MPPKAKEQEAVAIELPRLNIQHMRITVVGDSPLICHAWSHKAKEQMLAKQMKRAKPAKEAKDPEQDYLDSLYLHPDGGYGFPALAFKSAAVDACSHVAGVTKVEACGAFHIIGDLIRIYGEPSPREDMVRIAMGTADIRYRGEFRTWYAVLDLRFNGSVLSPEQITNSFNTGGFAIGVGEWRPQRDGSFGMFHVASRVCTQCSPSPHSGFGDNVAAASSPASSHATRELISEENSGSSSSSSHVG